MGALEGTLGYTIILVILELCQQKTRSYEIRCPKQTEWSLKARAKCGNVLEYFCVLDDNVNIYTEFCKRNPDIARDITWKKGQKCVFRGNLDGELCSEERYQPFKFRTDGNSDCAYKKSFCREEGMTNYNNGTTTLDTQCRCDHTKGFAFVSMTKHSCFCIPSQEDCSCYKKTCKSNTKLSSNYNCVFLDSREDTSACSSFDQRPSENIGSKTPALNQSKTDIMMVVENHLLFNVIITAAILVLTVMFIIVSSTCVTNIKKCCRNLTMTDIEYDERFERMREEKIKDKMKLMANYNEIITNVKNKDMVDSLKTLTDKDKDSIDMCTGRIPRNIALLDSVIEKGVAGYKDFICVLRQRNPDLAEKIENTNKSDYPKEYEDKYNDIYNEKIPKEVREFHDGKVQVWKSKDNMIIDTTASKEIRNLLTYTNCVVVVGSPGSGKSSILHHVALSFVAEKDTEDYEIIPVIVDPSKILEYHNDSRNQIFVIDNLCGKDKVNDQLIDLWKLDIESIYGIINREDCYEYEATVIRNKKTKLLMSCNSSIFENDIFLPLKKYLESFVCELSQFHLTKEERVDMLAKYAPEAGKNFIFPDEKSIANFDFPLLCELSARKPLNEIKKLFQNPLETIRNDLKNIQKTKPRHFCAIALCTIFNNELNEKWLNLKHDEKYIHTIDAVNEVCRELNLEHKNEREHIILQFDHDKIDWLIKSGNIYHFVHESIFNIASGICVESYTQCVINHASSSFLAERFELANLKNGKDPLIMKQYFNRLIRDLEIGITGSTFQNIQLKNKNYRKDFIEYCRNRELKVREILGNLKSINNVKDRTVKRPFCADSNCQKGSFCFDLRSVNSPLIECAWQGYADMVELLLDMKCDANETDAFGRSPLFIASAKGHKEIVKRLVEITKKENEGNENEGQLKIEENKKRMADITIRDNKGRTPLLIAFKEGHKPVIEYLIKKGADMSACDIDGNSPLHLSCMQGKSEVVAFLLEAYTENEKEREIENKNNLGQTPIIVASSTEGNDVVDLLLQTQANIHAIDNRGLTSLLTASMFGFSKKVQFLIDRGAKILHLDNDGRTALFIACKKGHLDTVKVLIEEGKTKILDVCDWHHKSPFYIACSERRTEIVKLLIENEVKIKADIDLCDENSKSPLHVACERSHDTIVQFLLENRAKMDTRDRHKNLPIHVACKVGNLKIVQLLCQSSSDNNYLSKTNQWKETPLYIAQKQDHPYIVKYLKTKNDTLR